MTPRVISQPPTAPMSHPGTLTDSQRDQLDRILEACPDLATVRDLAHEFSSIARERPGQGLTQAVFGSW